MIIYLGGWIGRALFMIILLFCVLVVRERTTNNHQKKHAEIHHFPETFWWRNDFLDWKFSKKSKIFFFLFFDLQRSHKEKFKNDDISLANRNRTWNDGDVECSHRTLSAHCRVASCHMYVVFVSPLNDRTFFFKIDIEISNQTIINRDQKRRHVWEGGFVLLSWWSYTCRSTGDSGKTVRDGLEENVRYGIFGGHGRFDGCVDRCHDDIRTRVVSWNKFLEK